MGRPATIYDLDGHRIGQTQQAVELFLAKLAEVLAETPCYVLVGPDCPPAFVESLRRFCPVVADADVGGQMLIVEGTP